MKWNVRSHPCPNFNDSLAELQLELVGIDEQLHFMMLSGPSFIKPDQLDPWIKDQLGNALLSTILTLQLRNFVSCGRACPSHMTQNLVTVGTKLLKGE